MAHTRQHLTAAALMLAIISAPAAADELKPYALPRDKSAMEACKQAALDIHPGLVRSARPQNTAHRFQYRFEIAGSDGLTWIIVCEAETRKIVVDQRLP